MRVLVCGAADRFSGNWCYCEALRSLGHEVTLFDDVARLIEARPPSWNRYYERVLRVPWEPARRRLVDSLVRATIDARAEVVLVMKGLFLGGDDVRRIQNESGAWTACVNHDDFYSESPMNWSILQREAVASWDRVFVTKEVNVGEIEALGASAEFLPFAYHPAIHRRVPVASDQQAALAFDVLFVGTWAPERGPFFGGLLESFNGRVGIFGNSWERLPASSPVHRVVQGRPLLGDEMAAAFSCARVSLGLLRKLNRDDHTQRSFEIPACYGVLLAERTQRHLSLYRDGEEAVFFDPDDPRELIEKVRWLVRDDDARERIRAAGHHAVTSGGHTYVDRISQILAAHERQRGR